MVVVVLIKLLCLFGEVDGTCMYEHRVNPCMVRTGKCPAITLDVSFNHNA